MACIGPDGKLSDIARRVLEAIGRGDPIATIAQVAGVPVYRVRASIRELGEAGLVDQDGDTLALTDRGRALDQES